MPKTKRRKHTTGRRGENKGVVLEQAAREPSPNVVRRSAMASGQSLQNAVFSAMVGLGCWGLACFFVFFYNEEPNHYLYGGLMAVTAIIWSIIATRRWSMYRQRA